MMDVQEMREAMAGESADLGQVAGNLIGKCDAEESEFQAAFRMVKRLKNVVFWSAIWLILAVIVMVSGVSEVRAVAVSVYLAVIFAVSLFALFSMRSISRQSIERPAVLASQEDIAYTPDQVEALFDYYWALDKRNDRVSTTMTIAGSVFGVGTILIALLIAAMSTAGL